MALSVRLEVQDLAFGYAGRVVGRDIGFALDAGDILCVLGPNGGGKTTLFRTILGLLAPLGGRMLLDGQATRGWTPLRLARVFGYVPQAQLDVFPFSVREIVLMGRTARMGLFGAPSRRDRATADEALATLGISRLADRPYTEISGGERQLTLIARALAQEPQILVMDEPTASLDFGNQVRVLTEAEALARRGIAVLFSSHDPEQAFLCAHRVALLHEGRLARVGRPDEVVTRESLRSIYGVEVQVVPLELSGGRRVRTCVPSLGRATDAGPRIQ